MNSDEIKSHILKIIGYGAAWAAGRYHLSQDQVAMIMSDGGYVAAAVAFVGGVALHWNKKLVPENATVVK